MSNSSRLNEFDLIEKFFKKNTLSRSDVLVGIGDDAALLQPPSSQVLVSSLDTLIEGVHFPIHTCAFNVGYKALAVNLSDLAAMGAEPAWMMLALTLPKPDTEWLTDFTRGLFELANQFNVQLIGGDTTRGPLSITLQVTGFVPLHHALRRNGAQAGDKIYVSGTVGDAGLGLQVFSNNYKLADIHKQYVLERLNKPTPRVELGINLRGIATSAIDISDGLLADLDHILKSSNVGAHIMAKNIPLSSALSNLTLAEAQQLALTAGDDYELCFTVPPEKENQLQVQLSRLNVPYCCIGEIEAIPGLRISGLQGEISQLGFQHFYS